MYKYLHKLFVLPSNEEALRKLQADEARLLALHHAAKAEEEKAMADMYVARAARLEVTAQ